MHFAFDTGKIDVLLLKFRLLPQAPFIVESVFDSCLQIALRRMPVPLARIDDGGEVPGFAVRGIG